MKRYLTLAIIALAWAPRGASAQATPEARIAAARRVVAAAGVPMSLLENRIAEGRAKGVPLERIAAVVERRAAALAEAQQVFGGPRVTSAEIAAGADALEAGVDAESLRSVIAAAADADRPVAIAVLTYLHRERGLPVGQALARVKAALRQGPDALRTLPSQAAGKARGHGPPEGRTGPPAAVPAPGRKQGAGKPSGKGGGPPEDRPGRGKP